MIFAPVLQDVAARMAGMPPGPGDDPLRQAYRLRDAVALVRPDWVVTHYDPDAETQRVRAAGDDIDLIDIALAAGPPVGNYVELTRVLTALYPGHTIAASLSGPAAMALGSVRGTGDAMADVLDCGDLLAGLVSEYVAAGATRIVIWETGTATLPADAVVEAHTPIVRKLHALGVPGVLCGGDRLTDLGYSAHAVAGSHGSGAALFDPGSFRGEGEFAFDIWLRESFGQSANGGTARDTVLLSNGPVAADSSMSVLRAAGQRAEASSGLR